MTDKLTFWTLHGSIDLLNPDPKTIDIRDIARGLATEYRYGGQTITPYSVAEHSVLVSLFVPEEYAKQALLHDAAEAYFKDIMRQVKRLPGFGRYRKMESRLQDAVFDRFGVTPTLLSYCKVKEIDMRITSNEVVQLISRAANPDLTALQFECGIGLPMGDIQCLSWPDAELLFLSRYAELFNAEFPE